jgi:hypothetical protein
MLYRTIRREVTDEDRVEDNNNKHLDSESQENKIRKSNRPKKHPPITKKNDLW